MKFGYCDEFLILFVWFLFDKLGGVIFNGVVGLIVVWVGMIVGVIVGDVISYGVVIFKLMMFGVFVVMILIGIFIFFKKVKLDEKMYV